MANFAEGAYLRFDATSQGTLFLHWSREPIPDSIAYMKPKVNVPNFKYTTSGGKLELARGTKSDGKKYYNGWASFIRLAKKFEGELTILPITKQVEHGAKEVVVVLLKSDFALSVIPENACVPLDGCICAGVFPLKCLEYQCPTLSRNLFLEKAEDKGAGIPF